MNEPDSLALARLRSRWVTLLSRHRAIAIIRASSVATGLAMAKAAAAGGFSLIEIAWNNNADPPEMIAAVQRSLPDCVVGAGSILSVKDLRCALSSEAKFCFTPHTDPELIRLAKVQSVPLVAGAMTPTEVLTAWRLGAASVKVFPISALGDSDYIRSLLGPMGPMPLVPTGGVTSESAPKLIAAGAVAVGLSTALFPKDEVCRGDWDAIEARSRYLLALLAKASQSSETLCLTTACSTTT